MAREFATLKHGPDHEDKAVMHEIAVLLHDLCQPLTALQCRLEIGKMLGVPDAYKEAVTESLRESERLLASVTAMRELVRQRLDQE